MNTPFYISKTTFLFFFAMCKKRETNPKVPATYISIKKHKRF